MIEIVQAGQAGKTSLLFDMHRLRARVFKDTLKWDVNVSTDGLETDQFDIPDALYLLALNNDQRVIGAWRLLPTTGPTMIRDLWPEFLGTMTMPASGNVWEASRFAVQPTATDPRQAHAESTKAVAEMFCGLTEFCLRHGIAEIFTFYDDRIARVIEKIDCQPYASSAPQPMKDMADGAMVRVGAFRTDAAMLERLRAATGVKQPLTEHLETPPYFADRRQKLAHG